MPNNIAIESYQYSDVTTQHNLLNYASTLLAPEEIAAMKIKAALTRYADINTNTVSISVNNDVVILNGRVNTLAQKNDAEEIAYMTMKGIAKVDNHLDIDIEYAGSDIYEF